MDKMPRLLKIRIPDVVIPSFFLVLEIIALIFLFLPNIKAGKTFAETYEELKLVPMLFIILYITLRTIVLDYIRLFRSKGKTGPGMLFGFSALLIFILYLSYDLLDNERIFAESLDTWVTLDPIFLSIFEIFIPSNFYKPEVKYGLDREFETRYMIETLLSIVTLMISIFLVQYR